MQARRGQARRSHANDRQACREPVSPAITLIFGQGATGVKSADHIQCARLSRAPMHTPAAARAICFGPFQLDPRTRELRKRGIRLRAPEQSIRILLALLDRAGDVVTRDELAAIL
jgi:DNA-binding response OmpR family regulator